MQVQEDTAGKVLPHTYITLITELTFNTVYSIVKREKSENINLKTIMVEH